MNEHPDLENEDDDEPRVAERHLEEIKQAVQHVGEARQRNYGWQQSVGGRKPVSGVVRPVYRVGRRDYS